MAGRIKVPKRRDPKQHLIVYPEHIAVIKPNSSKALACDAVRFNREEKRLLADDPLADLLAELPD